ncbi:uncharacterized protein [Rutidosis leptorrhynchoides]|uniref:uncharacterized protein n=1 Tax=Rutidosis leptorrhynchoides TaxID=125765 RepID=UPI003A9A634E
MVHAWRSGQRRKAEQLEEWEAEAIIFPPMQTINPSHAPIIIKGLITDCGYNVRRLNFNMGSNVDIMYEHYFRQLPAIIKSKMRVSTTVLSRFSGESAWPLGCIELELELDNDNDLTRMRDVPIEFCKFGAVPSTVHSMIKFPTKQGIATVRTESGRALCASVTPPKPLLTDEEQIQSSSILVNPKYPDKRIQVGGNLSDEIKVQLCDILVANMDVFAWCEDDMIGVPRNIVEHKLNANPNLTTVRQKRLSMAPKRSEWLRLEVDKLVHANILREVRYQTWVANPVLVKKRDGSWCMCVDFKDINKVCPKDNYPLPEIVWKVDSLSGFRFKCFLDAYKGIIRFRWQWGTKIKPHSTPIMFWGGRGKFLGHIVMQRGIKANPKKIEVVEHMNSPKSRKEVQSLTGKLAALTRFLSKAAERSLPFFQSLKNSLKKSDFTWTEEAEKAFVEMKSR